MRIALTVLAALAVAIAPARGQASASQGAIQPGDRFEPEIQAFEAADRIHPPTKGGIVFVGSSSIRLWETLATDFPGAAIINRGFGGSQLSDAVRFAPRIVLPYRPRLIVLYAGDNDLAEGKSPDQILRDYRAFVRLVRRRLPQTRIAFISVKPSPARRALAAQARRTNRLVRQYLSGDRRLRYVDVYTPMLDASGSPRPELYQADSLHMTAAGYAIWRDWLTPVVAATPSGTRAQGVERP